MQNTKSTENGNAEKDAILKAEDQSRRVADLSDALMLLMRKSEAAEQKHRSMEFRIKELEGKLEESKALASAQVKDAIEKLEDNMRASTSMQCDAVQKLEKLLN